MSDLAQPLADSPDHSTWSEKVRTYVDRLATLNETIDLTLDETRMGTVNVKPETVDQSREELTQAIRQLENMIPHRESLLAEDIAPKGGSTLRDKLLSTRNIDDARLARRCDEVSRAMENTRERCLALFVCQYHLSELSEDLIRAISGVTAPPTYDLRNDTSVRRPDKGGGLFNEAA